MTAKNLIITVSEFQKRFTNNGKGGLLDGNVIDWRIVKLSPWFSDSYVHYTENIKSKEPIIEGLVEKMSERKYSPTPTVSARVFSHWIESGIMDDPRADSKGWSKLNLYEFIWLKMLIKIRSFGLDFETIKKVKKHTWDTDQFFTFYVFCAFCMGLDVKLMIFSDGVGILETTVEVNYREKNTGSPDHISISMCDILFQVFDEYEGPINDLVGYYMNERDIEIARNIFENPNKASAIKITYSETGEVLLLEERASISNYEKTHNKPILEGDDLLDKQSITDILRKIDYGSVVINKSKGKVTTIQVFSNQKPKPNSYRLPAYWKNQTAGQLSSDANNSGLKKDTRRSP